MISLGNLFKKKKRAKLIRLQCNHCGKWFTTGKFNLRVTNYCTDCVD